MLERARFFVFLLPTAIVKLFIDDKLIGIYRALCDSGSHPNLIKHAVLKYYASKTTIANGSIIGIGNDPVRVRKKVIASIQPWFEKGDSNRITASFWVLPKASKWAPILPERDVPSNAIIRKLEPHLADPTFWKSDGISILLGIELWAEILEGPTHKLDKKLVAQESILGKVIFGRIGDQEQTEQNVQNRVKSVYSISLNELDESLKRFWHFDDLNLCEQTNTEHELVEKMFQQKHYRDSNGRFVVSIPLKPTVTEIGSSRAMALRRSYALEKRMQRDNSFKSEYVKFMEEYEQLEHMIEAIDQPSPNEMVYYIPHHGVITSSKFRVVFDGSCLTVFR